MIAEVIHINQNTHGKCTGCGVEMERGYTFIHYRIMQDEVGDTIQYDVELPYCDAFCFIHMEMGVPPLISLK